MAKLSIEIPDTSSESAVVEATCRLEGKDRDLLGCMAYLSQDLAAHFEISVPQLLSVVAASSGRIRRSIREVQELDIGAIENARKRGQPNGAN